MRSVGSPSVLSSPRHWPPSAPWLPTCAGRGTPRPRTSSRARTPRSGSPSGRTRSSSSATWASPGSRELAGDATYLARLGQAQADLDAYLSQDRWYQRKGGADAPRSIAYFSPEYGITAVLPQYSGGLGILAGDHLKSASDLGIPIIGVGLLYKHGYFKQSLSADGWQQETYPVLDPDELPLTPLREEDGSRAKVTVQLPGGPDLVATCGSRTWAGSRCCSWTPTSRRTPVTTAR